MTKNLIVRFSVEQEDLPKLLQILNDLEQGKKPCCVIQDFVVPSLITHADPV